MTSEEEVRRWVREEREAIKREEQAACSHAASGTRHADATITCDQCGKIVTLADADGGARRHSADPRVPM
jgi:hypothetical protein